MANPARARARRVPRVSDRSAAISLNSCPAELHISRNSIVSVLFSFLFFFALLCFLFCLNPPNYKHFLWDFLNGAGELSRQSQESVPPHLLLMLVIGRRQSGNTIPQRREKVVMYRGGTEKHFGMTTFRDP
ncbi:hypothetical protein CEXT_205801 [Caerostris extrusa]|uniref:Uncharacterized protein n=1 Tax=Caerostris extrusa TaxID=172846 RepID=A0AAV4WMV2_CAEEX|nr:hypothetical protein CEXT_205801 [Caerostris extrusa]